ncbi:unnamed protein product [Prunus brigantina]
MGARKTLAHRTVPSTPPVRPVAAVAPGRKRGREALHIEAAAVEVVLAESVVAETASSERPRKKVLLDLSEGEDEEEAPPADASEAPPVTEETAEEPGAEEVAAAEVVAEEEAPTEAVETLDTEVADIEDLSDDEAPVIGSPQGAKVDVALAASAKHSLVMTVPASPLPSAPPRPRGIVFRSVGITVPSSVVVTALTVVEAAGTSAPGLPPVSSGILTELSLFASLHEEGGSSASAPLDD